MKPFSKYNQTEPVTFSEAKIIWNDEDINRPDYNKIGLYNYDEMNTGGFLWFDSLEDLRFFIKNVWPTVIFRDDLASEILEKWQHYAEHFDNSLYTTTEGLEIINLKWQGEIQLGWLGTLEQLEQVDEDIPNQIREWFHETETAIPEKKKKKFLEFVKKGFC